ncbi:hypothetical protein [Candidatus Jidaibacter acanthamoebae]|nr:hypothetical protein [Candidatus Jidaibacter acanthamoeba]
MYKNQLRVFYELAPEVEARRGVVPLYLEAYILHNSRRLLSV